MLWASGMLNHVGWIQGSSIGFLYGGSNDTEGLTEGETDDEIDGDIEGEVDGDTDGDIDGLIEGDMLGLTEGETDGDIEGLIDGDTEAGILEAGIDILDIEGFSE